MFQDHALLWSIKEFIPTFDIIDKTYENDIVIYHPKKNKNVQKDNNKNDKLDFCLKHSIEDSIEQKHIIEEQHIEQKIDVNTKKQERYLIKYYKTSDCQKEFDIVKTLNHDNIIKYYLCGFIYDIALKNDIVTYYTHQLYQHHESQLELQKESNEESKREFNLESFNDGKKRQMERQMERQMKRQMESLECYKNHKKIDKFPHFICMEYCSVGDLFDWINKNYTRFTVSKLDDVIKNIIYQLINAVCYLHKNGVIHRDIKLDNIFIASKENDQLEIKLGDFDLMTLYTENLPINGKSGTLDYMPPELFLKCFYDGPKSDIWSIGVCIYILYDLNKPFGNNLETQDIITNIRHIKYKPLRKFHDANELLKKIFKYSSDRISMCDLMKTKYYQSGSRI
jgi:serine/threonine protein kinase